MRTHLALTIPLFLLACSSDSDPVGNTPDASHVDAANPNAKDTGTADDADLVVIDSGPPDSEPAKDAAIEDASDGGCSATWTASPNVDPLIAIPDGGGSVLLHAAATGTQDYTCMAVAVDGGTNYAWTFVGPEADLADCTTAKFGKHFASDAGAAAPEWQSTDGTYVVGKKLAAITPDGGASAVPWLLLQETSRAGAGTLGKTDYVQRVNTTGGLAPSAACAVGNVGTTQKVTYTADYYFYGQP